MWCGGASSGVGLLVIVGPLVFGDWGTKKCWAGTRLLSGDNLFEVVNLIVAGTAQQSLRICHYNDRRLVDCRLAKDALKHAMHLSPSNTGNDGVKLC